MDQPCIFDIFGDLESTSNLFYERPLKLKSFGRDWRFIEKGQAQTRVSENPTYGKPLNLSTSADSWTNNPPLKKIKYFFLYMILFMKKRNIVLLFLPEGHTKAMAQGQTSPKRLIVDLLSKPYVIVPLEFALFSFKFCR